MLIEYRKCASTTALESLTLICCYLNLLINVSGIPLEILWIRTECAPFFIKKSAWSEEQVARAEARQSKMLSSRQWWRGRSPGLFPKKFNMTPTTSAPHPANPTLGSLSLLNMTLAAILAKRWLATCRQGRRHTPCLCFCQMSPWWSFPPSYSLSLQIFIIKILVNFIYNMKLQYYTRTYICTYKLFEICVNCYILLFIYEEEQSLGNPKLLMVKVVFFM